MTGDENQLKNPANCPPARADGQLQAWRWLVGTGGQARGTLPCEGRVASAAFQSVTTREGVARERLRGRN